MTKDENSIIRSVRDYLYETGIGKIDVFRISEATGVPAARLLEIAPTPRDLVRKVFAYELIELAAIFDEYHFEDKNAIDILIIVGQEVYKKFHDINPSISYHLKNDYPDLYYDHLENKINFLVEHIIDNLKRGQEQGIYKEELDIETLKSNLKKKVAKLHEDKLLSSGKLTFEFAFNELIESFIRESSHSDWWSYYKQRRQLYEALDFNR